MARAVASPFSAGLIRSALAASVRKLDPRLQVKNPVMFVVLVVTVLVTGLWLHALAGGGHERPGFVLAIALWLWFTLLFANFAEALAEGRGRAQAEALRRGRDQTLARRLPDPNDRHSFEQVLATALRKGDHIAVETGETIAADGEIVAGIASVDESAITGESAPVIREAGGDRSSVTGGTRVLSDWIVVRVAADPGHTFLDRIIGLVEGSRRQKTPNEVALSILLSGLTLIFLIVCASLLPFTIYASSSAGVGSPVSMTMIVALFVCLIPTTIGGLLSAVGIAGMNRMLRANVIAMSGRAVEAAGDVDLLLLDKTGTITLGNRQATALVAAPNVDERALAEAALLASWADETPEGRSIVTFVQQRYGDVGRAPEDASARFVPFSAETRMSGVDIGERCIRKGAADAVAAHLRHLGRGLDRELEERVDAIARTGGTPLVVCDGSRALGVVHLVDVVKGGIRERFAMLRRMGIRTIMVTGDNPRTAAAIAAEAGVDDFLAEATPEAKLALIRRNQAEGRLVAMAGDGTNDAPALAQADVAVAMSSGTQAAKEASNMIDLDSDPTKLLETVEVGKQLLMTRGALTTFSLANDIAKYFAILPALFAGLYVSDTGESPLSALDIMQLESPESAVLSAVIFNALIIVALIPLALRGVVYRPDSAASLLRRNLLIYGGSGLLAPFVGIKLIDMFIALI